MKKNIHVCTNMYMIKTTSVQKILKKIKEI